MVFYWSYPIEGLHFNTKNIILQYTSLKWNCLWNIFNAQVLSKINGISAMFFLHILFQIFPVQAEMHTLSTSFR